MKKSRPHLTIFRSHHRQVVAALSAAATTTALQGNAPNPQAEPGPQKSTPQTPAALREGARRRRFLKRSRLPRIPPLLLRWKNDRQEPLEGLFGVDGAGLAGGHYERLASLDLVLNAVHRVLAYTLQDIRPRVANGLVGADLLTLVNTQRIRAQSRSGRICFANLRPFLDCSLMSYV